MDEIARAAGVTRQAAYLHFTSKRGLLLQLVTHIDRGRDVDRRVEPVWQAPNALAGLDIAAEVAAKTNEEVHRIALALDAARRWDADFAAAWEDRMQKRLARYRRIARWLADEGAVGAGWSERDAAAFMWTTTSIATYDLLVSDMKLSLRRYIKLLQTTLRATLQAPFDGHGTNREASSRLPRDRQR